MDLPRSRRLIALGTFRFVRLAFMLESKRSLEWNTVEASGTGIGEEKEEATDQSPHHCRLPTTGPIR